MSQKIVNEYGEVWGYVRVSTKEQHEDRQLIALDDYGVKKSHIFIDKQSGKNFNRPAYKKLIRIVRKGDIIVIKSIDRLGRNYQDIIDQWRMITQDIRCGIHVLDMPSLNTSGDPTDLLSKFITDMMLQVLSFVAENERENTIKRQREGIEAAKRKETIKIGRPKIKIPFDFWNIYVIWKTGEKPTKDIIKFCRDKYGMCQRTFYRRIREIDMRYSDIEPSKLNDLILDDLKDDIAFDMERCEGAIGYYNSYCPNPKYAAQLKKRQKKNDIENSKEIDAKEEEEELKRIILEKRQAEFRKQFGIDEAIPKHLVKRGRIPNTIRAKQAIKDAEQASTNVVKTIIID